MQIVNTYFFATKNNKDIYWNKFLFNNTYVEKECQVYLFECFSLRLHAEERPFEGRLCDLFEYDGMIKTRIFISWLLGKLQKAA